MAKNVRSEYLQRIIEEKNNLNDKLKEVTKASINSIMNENIEAKLRKLILEDEDSFEEEEVEDVEVPTDDTDETETVDVVDAEVDTEDETEVEADTDGETEEVGFEETETEGDDDIWNDLEQFKGEDGEYDLTGMDSDSLIKVMQVMKPEDGIRVVRNDNGTITLSDDETEKEYIIDIEDDCEGEECETEFEITTESEEHGNLGYGVRQKETAMTTPPNKEVAPNGAKTWDEVPTGTERRFGNGVGDSEPYNEAKDNTEEPIVEVELEACGGEEPVVKEAKRGGSRVNDKKLPKEGTGFGRQRNLSKDGETGKTGESPVKDTVSENIMRKANAIFKENEELKSIVESLKKQVTDCILINKSMGNAMKIVMENSTTMNEKKDILRRFSDVKSFEESDKLYKTISEELKREGKTFNVNNVINSQLAESKNHVVETPMYQTEDLSKTLDLIKRLNNIK